MVKRNFWVELIEESWRKRNLLWLSGVRRVGKTFLCKSLPGVEYFDCELPRTRRLIEEDPQSFFESLADKRIVLDEIHRLSNPSEILKICADHFPRVKVIATGSSTLGASKKFRDTLTGRKISLWLTPITSEDMKDFGNIDLQHRFLLGGLPSFFLSEKVREEELQEWIDAYWAKDIIELFRLEKRYSFVKFMELLLSQSGGIFEATAFSRPCEVSRSTITNYLSILEATFIVHIVRPFSSHRPSEIISAPKVYGFDTGFICYCKGWKELRPDDYGLLWEHFVLNEIHARLQTRKILYWRDKQGHEIDFVIERKGSPVAIECKWKSVEYDLKNLLIFRRHYPGGENYIVSTDVDREFKRKVDNITVHFVSLDTLIDRLRK